MADYAAHPAHRYALAVCSGEIVAGKLVRQACGKYLDEMEADQKRRVKRSSRDRSGKLVSPHFDVKAAQRSIDFFAFLTHSKGEWAGQVFELEPWQQFILWNVFGWKREDGTRRYRTVHIEIARKNGKTQLGAGIGLYMLVADKEGGAEVYAAATKRDQAKILWDEAKRMVWKSKELSSAIAVYRSTSNLSIDSTASKFEPLGADADTLDGLNVHCAIVDELHAHKSSELYEVLETSTGARRQPLMLSITTAGTDETSFCYEQHEYAEKILSGVLSDDTFFSYIATLDEGDAWDDPSVWIKANPNLGVSVKRTTIEEAVATAKSSPRKQNAVRRYRLNQWTRAETRFIDLARWDAGASELMPAEIEKLTLGRIGYGGLDLSTTTDISAFVAVFPPQDDGDLYDVVCKFWIPGEDLAERERKGRVPYQQWVDEGWITATDGDVIDYTLIRDQIIAFGEDRQILQIAHDPYNAAATVAELTDEGCDMVKFIQGALSFNNPTKQFERLVLSKKLRHGMNPVLRWMVDNVTVATDARGNIMPKKPEHKMSHKKIDGVVSLIMALDRALRNEGVVDTGSIYEERGVLVL